MYVYNLNQPGYKMYINPSMYPTDKYVKRLVVLTFGLCVKLWLCFTGAVC